MKNKIIILTLLIFVGYLTGKDGCPFPSHNRGIGERIAHGACIQRLGKDANENEKTRFDRIEVDEIDADSSQKIVLMPPTGEKTKYGFIVLLGISIIVIGTFILKKVLSNGQFSKDVMICLNK